MRKKYSPLPLLTEQQYKALRINIWRSIPSCYCCDKDMAECNPYSPCKICTKAIDAITALVGWSQSEGRMAELEMLKKHKLRVSDVADLTTAMGTGELIARLIAEPSSYADSRLKVLKDEAKQYAKQAKYKQ